MSSSHSKTPLVALGFASCQLPLLVAVAVGWWTAWAGLAAGVGVSVLFSVAWARRARQQLFLLGIAAGLVFSIVGASLTLPSLRHLVGALPSYQLGTPYDSRADTPMAVELVSIQGGAPRTDLLYQGDVLRTRSEGGTSYLYSVVAPIAPVDWEPGRPVPAWAICEVSREGKESKRAPNGSASSSLVTSRRATSTRPSTPTFRMRPWCSRPCSDTTSPRLRTRPSSCSLERKTPGLASSRRSS